MDRIIFLFYSVLHFYHHMSLKHALKVICVYLFDLSACPQAVPLPIPSVDLLDSRDPRDVAESIHI